MIHKTTQLSVMAVAALAIVAVVAVALFAAGGARAENTNTMTALPHADGGNAVQPQGGGGGQPTPEPTPERPPGPPCPPEPGEEALDEVSSGHYGIFDVCLDEESLRLHTNPYPPAVEHSPSGHIRTPAGIDIGKTDIHVTDATKGMLVEPGHGQSTEGRSIKVAPDSPVWAAYQAGEEMTAWVLPQWVDDDEDESGEAGESGQSEPASDDALYLGFSAGLLDPRDWQSNPETEFPGAEVQYEFEHEEYRHIGPGEGHAFVAHASDFNQSSIDWSTLDPDDNDLNVPAGEYEHRSWIFTKPGTYIFQVHVKGHPNRGGEGSVFPQGHPERTETSEVREYKFHVGNLVVNEDPILVFDRSVPENSPENTAVDGDRIKVRDENDNNADLNAWFTGDGKDNFKATVDAAGVVQIAVAADANLDYETTPSYDLTLNISDDKTHESNPNSKADIAAAVVISITDNPYEGITAHVEADNLTPNVGETVTLTETGHTPPVSPLQIYYDWYERRGGETRWVQHKPTDPTKAQVVYDTPTSAEYWVEVRVENVYTGQVVHSVTSDTVTVEWQNPKG